jgi:penicillin-binding protein 1A
MSKVLKDVPETFMPQPPGLVALETPNPGKGPAKELFYKESVPVTVEDEPPQSSNSKPVD